MLANIAMKTLIRRSTPLTVGVRSFSKQQIGEGEWGIKYDDECLKFEKEWKQIADEVEEK